MFDAANVFSMVGGSGAITVVEALAGGPGKASFELTVEVTLFAWPACTPCTVTGGSVQVAFAASVPPVRTSVVAVTVNVPPHAGVAPSGAVACSCGGRASVKPSPVSKPDEG